MARRGYVFMRCFRDIMLRYNYCVLYFQAASTAIKAGFADD